MPLHNDDMAADLFRDRESSRNTRCETVSRARLSQSSGRVLVIRKARVCDCHLELNAPPDRLDLADTYCQMAKAEGVLISSQPRYSGRPLGDGRGEGGDAPGKVPPASRVDGDQKSGAVDGAACMQKC